MESIDLIGALAALFEEHGFVTILVSALSIWAAVKRKALWSAVKMAFQAETIIDNLTKANGELRDQILEMRAEYEAQISELRMQIEKQNELILAQTRSIAQLEEKYKGAAEVARKYFNRSRYDDEA